MLFSVKDISDAPAAGEFEFIDTPLAHPPRHLADSRKRNNADFPPNRDSVFRLKNKRGIISVLSVEISTDQVFSAESCEILERRRPANDLSCRLHRQDLSRNQFMKMTHIDLKVVVAKIAPNTSSVENGSYLVETPRLRRLGVVPGIPIKRKT